LNPLVSGLEASTGSCCAVVGGTGGVETVCGHMFQLANLSISRSSTVCGGLLWLASLCSSRDSRVMGGWEGGGRTLPLLHLICVVASASIL
jgi:hypothetical protein